MTLPSLNCNTWRHSGMKMLELDIPSRIATCATTNQSQGVARPRRPVQRCVFQDAGFSGQRESSRRAFEEKSCKHPLSERPKVGTVGTGRTNYVSFVAAAPWTTSAQIMALCNGQCYGNVPFDGIPETNPPLCSRQSDIRTMMVMVTAVSSWETF